MDGDPEVATISQMHKDDLAPVRQSLFEHLSGWRGGPPLFVQKRGSPYIAKAHRPFQIDAATTELWMKCMSQTMVGIDERFRQMPAPAFRPVAQALENA